MTIVHSGVQMASNAAVCVLSSKKIVQYMNIQSLHWVVCKELGGLLACMVNQIVNCGR